MVWGPGTQWRTRICGGDLRKLGQANQGGPGVRRAGKSLGCDGDPWWARRSTCFHTGRPQEDGRADQRFEHQPGIAKAFSVLASSARRGPATGLTPLYSFAAGFTLDVSALWGKHQVSLVRENFKCPLEFPQLGFAQTTGELLLSGKTKRQAFFINLLPLRCQTHHDATRVLLVALHMEQLLFHQL